jgi:hypothetical protein
VEIPAVEFDNRTGVANITDNGTTTPVDVQEICDGLGASLVGPFDSGSVQPQVSYDGTSFADFGSPVTASGHATLPPCQSVQFVTTGVAAASAAIVVRLGGIKDTTNPGKVRR